MKKIIISLFVSIAFSFAAMVVMVRIGTGNGLTTGTAYQLKISATNAASSWVLLPKDVLKVAVSVFVASNSGRVEYTTVRVEDVLATTHIFTWPLGTVTNSVVDSLLSPVTALRVVGTSNVATMYIRAQ